MYRDAATLGFAYGKNKAMTLQIGAARHCATH